MIARQAQELDESRSQCEKLALANKTREEESEKDWAMVRAENEELRSEIEEQRKAREKLESEVTRLREELETVKGGSTGRSLRQSVEGRQMSNVVTTRKGPGIPTAAGSGHGIRQRGMSLSEGGNGPPSTNNSFCSDQRSETKSERDRVHGSYAAKELYALLERAENYKKISEHLSKQIEEHKVLEYRQTLKRKAGKIKMLKKDREDLMQELSRAKHEHQAEKNVLSENERKLAFMLQEKDEKLLEMKRKLNFFELDGEQRLCNVLSADEEESAKRNSHLSALRSKSMENTANLNKKLARMADEKFLDRPRHEPSWKLPPHHAEVRRSHAWELGGPRILEEERKEDRLQTFDSMEGNYSGQGGISYRGRLMQQQQVQS